ncbi:unnamed protein product [Timema podura]|uniref:Uncharacterized protein n=1 Tax=Timema podura TaxID=61482 RepID=A0ABN7P5T7_TIMPD|nr:unnamed protein product [Timema podura]
MSPASGNITPADSHDTITCLRDLDQAESYTTSESDLGAWLSDLRELIRKSNQLYIEDLMKELRSENPQAPSRRYELPLFAGRRKSLSRILSQDGLTCRETVEKVLEPGTGPSFGYTSLAIQVRAQFPLWQWPLDLEPLGSLLNHLQITEDDDPEEKTAEYLEDLLHLGYGGS